MPSFGKDLPDESSLTNVSKSIRQVARSPKIDRLRELRCLHLTVLEAHRLPPRLVPNPYCIVALNQVRRTIKKKVQTDEKSVQVPKKPSTNQAELKTLKKGHHRIIHDQLVGRDRNGNDENDESPSQKNGNETTENAQVKVARTRVYLGSDPVWDQEFLLDDIPPDVMTLTLTVCNKGKRSKVRPLRFLGQVRLG